MHVQLNQQHVSEISVGHTQGRFYDHGKAFDISFVKTLLKKEETLSLVAPTVDFNMLVEKTLMMLVNKKDRAVIHKF